MGRTKAALVEERFGVFSGRKCREIGAGNAARIWRHCLLEADERFVAALGSRLGRYFAEKCAALRRGEVGKMN